ncbi:hypothetical protein [Streptomyces sp. 8N706]|uniref:hypothetical protein n=1 Tax=Streptomyces sp. 8N706 TaxID=3457416 RepID=UPI003FD28429
MSLVYCQRWNKRLAKPIKPLTVKEAERLHDAGEPYAVVSFNDAVGRVNRVVELALRSGHVRVYFFDEYNRVEMTYTFGPTKELLFLRSITTYDYGDSTEYLGMSQCERIEEDEFREDGTGLHTVRDERTGESFSEELHLKPSKNLDELWESVPEFGHYASIGRGSRSQPPIPFG